MSILSQFFPPKPKWIAKDMPDMSGMVCVVTGGNSGIGRETVKALLKHNATVYIFARSPSKARTCIEELKSEADKEAGFVELDLANLASIKTAVSEFCRGVMIPPIEDLTADGYDLQFGVDVLGHFFLTQLLLPLLLSTASSDSNPTRKVRVITTSSLGHLFTPMNFEALLDRSSSGGEGEEAAYEEKVKKVREKMGPQNLYMMSKYGNVVFASELAKRYSDQGIISISVNPGNIKSDLMRNASIVQKIMLKLLLYPTEQGAITQIFDGTAPEAADMNGKYLIPFARVGKARVDALDPVVGEKLWAWMERQVVDI
ncbi:hypothetical protein PHLCEN_2v10244 [Hermanssonia centrifuga]|uniref:NAD(P)-binding protein n=1 Tax=Hermanssonia centrifuga TaxID=98765 RepID=A0A2R6NNF1_9APHY|nr:hypothetical protein PHLCEN_2v10244 [Hermanssonia centrifuga]